MKVYVVVDEWARDDAEDVQVIGVHTDKKKAQEEMLKEMKERFLTEMDTSERDDMSVCQYDAGDYHNMHDRIFIQERELDD